MKTEYIDASEWWLSRAYLSGAKSALFGYTDPLIHAPVAKRSLLGEHEKLCLAVFQAALDDLRYIHSFHDRERLRQRDAKDALVWLQQNDHEYALSFVNCCTALRLDPSAVRRAVGTRFNILSLLNMEVF